MKSELAEYESKTRRHGSCGDQRERGGGRLVMHLGFLLLKGTKPGEKC